MKKRIVLCADDYGQALAISKAIIMLVQQKRITATSCLVNSPHWPEHAGWLLPFKDQIDIGLHFNLTQGQALSREFQTAYGASFSPLSKVLVRSLTQQFQHEIIVAELEAQLDAFQKALGFLPDYLDGHQHVHQFPVIRNALLEVYEKHLRSPNAYVRSVNMPLKASDVWRDFKKVVIQLTGGATFSNLLTVRQIPHNRVFSGIYSFNPSQPYPDQFRHFLATIADGGLIMCHPGLEATTGQDPIEEARFNEFQYFSSEQFLKDCEIENITLTRFQNSA